MRICFEETRLLCDISQFGRAVMAPNERRKPRSNLEDLAISREVVLACFIITIIDVQHPSY